MDRILTYQIGPSEGGLRIEQFLRRRGYSLQNLTQLKKMKESVLVNGIIKNRERLSYSGVPTGWSGILPVLPLSQSIC